MVLRRRLFRLESDAAVRAVAEGLVLRLATAAKVNRRELIFLIFFPLVVEQFRSSRHFVWSVLCCGDLHFCHDFFPFLIDAQFMNFVVYISTR